MANIENLPFLGFGLGLRPQHYSDILAGGHGVDWFEIISENYMVAGGRALHNLDRVRADHPIVMHGVSMSIASTDPLDMDYLGVLKALAARIEPAWISDHLCWTGVHGINLHDLLPVPFTREALDHVVERISRVQDFLGRRIAIENASSYVSFSGSEMEEWEFVAEMTRRADCLLLVDVNNVYVASFNHGFDPAAYLAAMPADRVVQMHLAGHEHRGTHIVDTHDDEVSGPVWDLYREAVRRFGAVSTMIERDDRIPPLSELIAELGIARRIAGEVLGTGTREAAA